jgi:hypothetical protein
MNNVKDIRPLLLACAISALVVIALIGISMWGAYSSGRKHMAFDVVQSCLRYSKVSLIDRDRPAHIWHFSCAPYHDPYASDP